MDLEKFWCYQLLSVSITSNLGTLWYFHRLNLWHQDFIHADHTVEQGAHLLSTALESFNGLELGGRRVVSVNFWRTGWALRHRPRGNVHNVRERRWSFEMSSDVRHPSDVVFDSFGGYSTQYSGTYHELSQSMMGKPSLKTRHVLQLGGEECSRGGEECSRGGPHPESPHGCCECAVHLWWWVASIQIQELQNGRLGAVPLDSFERQSKIGLLS